MNVITIKELEVKKCYLYKIEHYFLNKSATYNFFLNYLAFLPAPYLLRKIHYMAWWRQISRRKLIHRICLTISLSLSHSLPIYLSSLLVLDFYKYISLSILMTSDCLRLLLLLSSKNTCGKKKCGLLAWWRSPSLQDQANLLLVYKFMLE